MKTVKSFGLVMLYFALLGTLLSGYLSYHKLFSPAGCGRALITCGTNPVQIFGVSQCIYGFAMFFLASVIAILIIQSRRPGRWLTTQLGLSLVGTLFAGSLSFYELWVQKPAPLTMPSCVYGFFLYLGVLLTTILASQTLTSSEPVSPATPAVR